MIFISFVEEFWNGQKENTTMGRIEVYTDGEYADEEIRWGTYRVDDFYEFRAAWDFRDITEHQLEWLRKYVAKEYMIKSKEE